MLRQMRSLYAKSNTSLSNSHCSAHESYCTIYCPFLWNSYKKSTFNKIRVADNNVYRKIFDLPKKSSVSAMYSRCNICSFESKLRESIYGFMQRLENSTNSIINVLSLIN